MKKVKPNRTFVLIPTCRDFKSIKPCINSIKKNNQSANTHIYVIENGEKKDLKSKLEKYFKGSINYLHTEEPGKSAALNYCIDELSFNDDDLLLFTDDDIFFNYHWIIKYKAYCDSYGFIYGASHFATYDFSAQAKVLHLLPNSMIGLNDLDYSQAKYLFMGFNWAIYWNDLKEIKYFDNSYGPGSITKSTGQETQMFNRLIKNGLKLKHIKDNYVAHQVSKEVFEKNWIMNRLKKDSHSRYKRSNNKLKLFTFVMLFTPVYICLSCILKTRKNSYKIFKRKTLYLYFVYEISIYNFLQILRTSLSKSL